MNDSLSLRQELDLSEARSLADGLPPTSLMQLWDQSTRLCKKESITSSAGGMSCRMRTVIQRIQDLKCPYLEGLSDEMVRGVVFNSGEARMRLLTWMSSRLGPGTPGVTTPHNSAGGSSAPRLTSLLADAGLCAREDLELVKGTSAGPKQLLFMEAFVGVVSLAVLQQERLNTSLADKMQSVPWQMERCCHFVDELSRHNQLSDVFPSSLSLIPPAMAVSVDRGGVVMQDPQGYPVPPSLSELSLRCEEARTVLEKKMMELESLKQMYSYADLRPDALASCHKMIGVTLGTLSQLATAFCHTYEAELQPWTNTETPHLSGLGPLCRRVDHLKQNLDKLLDALGVLERSYREINELGKVSLGNRDHLSQDAYEALKDSLAILKDIKLTES